MYPQVPQMGLQMCILKSKEEGLGAWQIPETLGSTVPEAPPGATVGDVAPAARSALGGGLSLSGCLELGKGGTLSSLTVYPVRWLVASLIVNLVDERSGVGGCLRQGQACVLGGVLCVRERP